MAEDELAAPDEDRRPDPHKPTQIFVSGKKGQGKTELAWLVFVSYPYDRALIDPNGDIKTDGLVNVVELSPPIPARWPTSQFEDPNLPGTVVFRPDFEDDDYLADMDRVVRLCRVHGRCCLFVDECHELINVNRVPPAARRALRQGRHDDLTSIWATPRPMTIDPLAISNADWVYTFKLRNPDDRERVAKNIGWNPRDFEAAVADLGDFEYLRYDDGRDDLAWFPPLPPELLTYHKG